MIPIETDVGAKTMVGAATKTIVVADETAFVRDRFRAALSAAGHRVLVASSRSELMASIKKLREQIDLLVLDARLSASDAGSLIRQVQKLLPHGTPIVAFSGTVGSTGAVRALARLNVTAFINEYTGESHIVPALHPFLNGTPECRRSSPRVPLGTAVTFRQGHKIVTAVTLNISRGGIAIRSTNPLPVGMDVHLKLRLPSPSTEVEADARVVWSDPLSGMGLQFSTVGPEHQTAIDEFVNGHFFANRKG